MTTTQNNVAAQAGDEPMRDLAASIKALKCTPPDYRNYAMDAEQRGYHKDGFRDGFKAAISSAAALAAQVSPRATADVERVTITPALRRAVDMTRADLGESGSNYPFVRELLAFAESHIATTKPGA